MAWSQINKTNANSLIAQLPNSPEDLSSSNSPIRLLVDKKISIQQADAIMNSIVDLVPQTSAYRPKYYAALYRMEPNLFLELADRARKGKAPQHLFRVLIDGLKK